MPQYVDGFVFPISLDKIENYQKMAAAVAEIWREYGALEYREFVGDDMNLEGTRSFTELTAGENQIVVFGWVAFESRVARDLANQKVANDPRVAKLVSESDCGFDPSRMVYGGFKSLVA